MKSNIAENSWKMIRSIICKALEFVEHPRARVIYCVSRNTTSSFSRLPIKNWNVKHWPKMKSTASNESPRVSKSIASWDDAVFDPAELVQDMQELADHYEEKKKLTLRTYSAVVPCRSLRLRILSNCVRLAIWVAHYLRRFSMSLLSRCTNGNPANENLLVQLFVCWRSCNDSRKRCSVDFSVCPQNLPVSKYCK